MERVPSFFGTIIQNGVPNLRNVFSVSSLTLWIVLLLLYKADSAVTRWLEAMARLVASALCCCGQEGEKRVRRVAPSYLSILPSRWQRRCSVHSNMHNLGIVWSLCTCMECYHEHLCPRPSSAWPYHSFHYIISDALLRDYIETTFNWNSSGMIDLEGVCMNWSKICNNNGDKLW